MFTQQPVRSAPFISYMILLMAVSVIPSDAEINFRFMTDLNPELQNFLHIPAYAILAILWQERWRTCRKLSVFLGVTAYGIANEFIQIVVPGRFFSVSDMGLNIIGAILGIHAFTFLIKTQPRPE